MFGRLDFAVTVGRIAGAPVKIGPGSLVLASYFAIQLGLSWSDRSTPAIAWTIAALTGLGFMLSILVHEAAHALVARRRGVGVEEIRLWLLGGSAAMSRRSPDPNSEMLISGAGPAATLALSAMFFGLGRLVSGSVVVPYFDNVAGSSYVDIGAEGLFWLGTINLLLGVFNLLPALPLDGGRVLSGAMWKFRGDRVKALQTVISVSKVMAYLAFGFAALELFVWNSGFPIWTMFIGWMFLNGGQGELAAASLTKMVSHLTVADVARSNPATVHYDTNTASARALLPDASTLRYAVVVDDDGIARGLLDLGVLSFVADADGTNPVLEVMKPIDERNAVYGTESLGDVLDRGAVPPLVVIDEAWRPIGLIDSIQQLSKPVAVPTPNV